MFICKSCCIVRGVDKVLYELAPVSLGACEVCGTMQPSLDIHHSKIPTPSESHATDKTLSDHAEDAAATYNIYVPPRDTPEWQAMYESWVEWAFDADSRQRGVAWTHAPAKVPFSQEDVDRYIRGGGVACLYCGSDDIEGDSFSVEADGGGQAVYCMSCEQRWAAMYKLDGVTDGRGTTLRATQSNDTLLLLRDCETVLDDTASWLSVAYNGQHGRAADDANDRHDCMTSLVSRIRTLSRASVQQ